MSNWEMDDIKMPNNIGIYINGNTLVKRSKFKIKNKILRLGEVPKYEFPDVIEIKVTNKCIYECSMCQEKSKSNGTNKIQYDILISKLSELPKIPCIFILRGGNILENLKELYHLIKFLKSEFQGCVIISYINALDVKRIENLSHCSFGRDHINKFIFGTDYFSVSLGQYYDKSLLKFTFANNTGLARLTSYHNIIFRLEYGSPIKDILRDISENYYNNSDIMIPNEMIIKNKDIITETIDNLELHLSNSLKIYLESNILGSKEKYLLGWNNYMFIDAVEGKFSMDKKTKVSWDNIKLLEFYDTYNKQRVLSEK